MRTDIPPLDLLTKRARRLVELIELAAPPKVVAREVIMITEAAVAYCGTAYAEAIRLEGENGETKQ